MIILLIISFILNLILLIGVRNLLIQVENAEDRLNTTQEFFDVVQTSLKNIINSMRAIDIGGRFKPQGPDESEGYVEIDGILQLAKPGAFERSDEVSTTFHSMLQLVEQLNAFVTPQEENAKETDLS